MVDLGDVADTSGRDSTWTVRNPDRSRPEESPAPMRLDIELLERTFADVADRLDEITMQFYSDLFTRHPEVRPFFASVDLVRQRRKLAAMLSLIVTNLRRMDVLVSALRALGAKHPAWGATEESYRWVAESLVRSLCLVAGDRWTEAAEAAWSAAIRLVCFEMQAGVQEEVDPALSMPSEEDLQLLMEIAANPALSFRRDSLFSNYVQKKRADHEMSLARTVQSNLIPEAFPEVVGYRFGAVYVPAAQVGGDYYDWMMPDGRRLNVLFGDVSGKGVPGALIMCRLAGTARTVLASNDDPADALRTINAHMCERMPRGRFITLALLQLDLETHRYLFANAGHEPPLRRRGAAVTQLVRPGTGGIPIGITTDASYEVVEGVLEPDETVVFSTDGVDEARDPFGNMYGRDRVRGIVASEPTAANIANALRDDLRAFGQGRPQADDITILTVTRVSR